MRTTLTLILLVLTVPLHAVTNPAAADRSASRKADAAPAAAPIIDPPEMGAYRAGRLTIDGSGFGLPGPDAHLTYTASSGRRVWFTAGGLSAGNAIASFDPDRIVPDCLFDFSGDLDSLICPDGGPYDDCFRYYPMPAPGGQHQDKDDPGLAAIGYFSRRLGVHITLPPMADLPGSTDPAGAGIVWDPVAGTIRFAEFWEKEVGQLKEVF